MKKTIGTIFALLLFVSYALAGPPVGGGGTGASITLDTTNFDGQLSGSDITVQAASETIDEISAGGDEVQVDSGATVNPDFQDGGDINFTNTTNVITATLKDDVVAAAEMADADHGDVAWSGGVAEVQAITAADTGNPDATFYVTLLDGATGTQEVETDTYFYYNSLNNMLTTGVFRARDTDPAYKFMDDDAPGSDKDIANMIAVYVDGGDGAENADFSIRTTKGGSEDTIIAHYDESQDQWELPESLEITGDVIFPEKADHTSTPGAGFGYLWVRNDTPSALIYTDDAGTDHDLTAASTVDTSGTPVANDLARFTDADTIEGLSYAELWAVAGYLSAALAELDDENWTFTGDVDLSGANSVTMGPLTFEDGNATPDAVGEFMYNNTITGLDDGALVWYDDDEVRILIDLDASEGTLASGDDGKLVRYNWSSGSGYFDLTSAGAGDLLANGTIPLTANWDVGSYSITALTFTSDQATGTAPFTVASTTVVTNLNADTVDGESASTIVTAARVGASSANLDDTDASIEWEDAAELQSDGSLAETGIALTSLTVGTLLGETTVGGGVFLTDNNYVELDATADGMDDDEYNGVVIGGRNCGEGLTQWDTVRLANDADPWHQADANAAGEFPAHGLSVAACTDTNEARILVRGVVRNEGWTGLTPGGAVYLSETPGGVTQTAPSDSGDCVQIVGWALSDSEIYFDFSRPYGEVQ